jgi:hypothetical protein
MVSVWIFFDAPKQKRSRLFWPVAAVVVPLLVPYYITKSRPKKKWRYIGLWILGLYVCHAITNELVSGSGSTLNHEISSLIEKARSSSSRLQETFGRLDRIGELKAVPQISEGIELIDSAQQILRESEEDLEKVMSYITENETQLEAEGLTDYISIQSVFHHLRYSYLRSAEEYLDTYKKWLDFSRDHYDSIIARNEPESTLYEEHFTQYEDARMKHAEAYSAHVAFVRDYVARHPDPASKPEAMIGLKEMDKEGRY